MRISIYNLHFAVLGGGERRTALLAAHLSRHHEVTLFVLSPPDVGLVQALFGIDLSRVHVVALNRPVAGEGDFIPDVQKARPQLFINNSHGSTLPCPARWGIYMCMFPQADTCDLSGYDVVTANSRYTAAWVKKKWGCPAEVVYSACELMGPGPEKNKVVLNVARFMADAGQNHHKRQEVLIEAFRRMIDAGLDGWELHLVGNAGKVPRDQAFLETLQRMGEHYPVRIQVGMEGGQLRREYQSAAIYWHATGYGSRAEQHPNRQEHFGMTIVEAMSAGAVPLAYNAGGPKETILTGTNGYLWQDPDELVARTARLIEDPAHREALAARAVADSRQFGAHEFLARMDAIIAKLPAAA